MREIYLNFYRNQAILRHKKYSTQNDKQDFFSIIFVFKNERNTFLEVITDMELG